MECPKCGSETVDAKFIGEYCPNCRQTLKSLKEQHQLRIIKFLRLKLRLNHPNPIPIKLGLINKIIPSRIIINPPMNFIICICLLVICFEGISKNSNYYSERNNIN